VGIYFIVQLGQEAVVAAADLSPNPATLTAKHRGSWVVDDAIYTDDAEMIHDFEQILNSGLVSFSVRADDLDAVYALTAANASGDRIDVSIVAYRMGVELANLKLPAAKIRNVIPLWGEGHKTMFYVANIDDSGQSRKMGDKRPPHTSVRGEE